MNAHSLRVLLVALWSSTRLIRLTRLSFVMKNKRRKIPPRLKTKFAKSRQYRPVRESIRECRRLAPHCSNKPEKDYRQAVGEFRRLKRSVSFLSTKAFHDDFLDLLPAAERFLAEPSGKTDEAFADREGTGSLLCKATSSMTGPGAT